MGMKLDTLLSPSHPLCRHSIDWHDIYALFPELLLAGYKEHFLRLMGALVILQERSQKDAESLFVEWCENPYWQAFSGITEFQWSPPATVEQFLAFQRIAGPRRLQTLKSMAGTLTSSAAVPNQPMAQSGAHHGSGEEAADIRRSLIPTNQDETDGLSTWQAARKVIPHFESVEPIMLNLQSSEEGLQIHVEPMGEAPFRYRWEKWVENEAGVKVLEECATASIHIENPPTECLIAFRCVVSNAHAPNGTPSRWHFIRPQKKPAKATALDCTPS